MRLVITATLASLALAGLSIPAFADPPPPPPPPPAGYYTGPVNIDQVRVIAFSHGIKLIDKIRLTGPTWLVRGTDISDHSVRMRVDVATGAVVDMRRR